MPESPSPASEPPSASSDEPEGTFGQFLGCIAMFAGVAAAIVGLVWLGISLFSDSELARLSLGPDPAEVTFQLEEETAVQVWTLIDFRHEGISPSLAHEDLPHVVDYVVEIHGEGDLVHAARCNPFNTNFARTSGKHNSIGEPAGRMYDGLIRDCGATLPPGGYTVRAHRVFVGEPDNRFRFDTTALILRGG